MLPSQAKALSKIKRSNAAGPSGIVAEVWKAAGEEGVELARQLTEVFFQLWYDPIKFGGGLHSGP